MGSGNLPMEEFFKTMTTPDRSLENTSFLEILSLKVTWVVLDSLEKESLVPRVL